LTAPGVGDIGPALEVRLERRVHQGLRLDLGLTLGPECGVVFGRSGAGKTTLLRLIAGLDDPDAGHVRLGGETVYDSAAGVSLPLRARRVAMVFQDDLLFPHLSVAENIRFGLKGRPHSEAGDRLAEVAALCGVEGLLGRRPATLSGGERQRVGLARALAPRPRLLLCDEPVSALDLTSRHALVERLRAVQAAEAIPVLYVTHSPAEAVALGSRLFLIDQGRITDQGPPLDVLARSGPEPEARLGGVRNEFAAVVEDNPPGGGETRLRLTGGPTLVVPRLDHPPGTSVVVAVLAEEVLIARGAVEGLSARNVIPGEVERVLAHGPEAEVLVRTGGLTWVVSVVAPAVEALGLGPGAGVHLIVKARSCRVQTGEGSPGGALL
jgi:molybdate transport system ATP-binding protein